MPSIDFLNKEAFLLLQLLLGGKCHLRQLAEKAGIAPSTVHNVMKKLAAQKIVLVSKQKNRAVFSLNYDSPLAASVLRTVFVAKLIGSKAFKQLKQLKPLGICLFGTAASGKATADSDIDLAVYFQKKPDSLLVSQIKRELSNELKREIQLIVLTESKIASMKKGGSELLNQIRANSVVLAGEQID